MDEKMAKLVEVRMEGHGRGKVIVDGVELEGVISVEVSAGVNHTNVVSVVRHQFIRSEVTTFSGSAAVTDEKVTS